MNRMLFISSKIISVIRYQLTAWHIWGNQETEDTIDRILIQLYMRIFGIHVKETVMKKWLQLEMNTVYQKSGHITEWLRLPKTRDILNQTNKMIKIKSL